MKNLQKIFSAKNIFILAVLVLELLGSVSCSKDKKDEPDQNSSNLVGTWYYMDDYGTIDRQDYFLFNSNGTGIYYYDGDSDYFTYNYDSKSDILILNYKDWDTEYQNIRWIGTNKIEIEDYGIYVRN